MILQDKGIYKKNKLLLNKSDICSIDQKNRQILILLLGPVGFNNSKEIDPWDDKLRKIDENGKPEWAKMGFYENYKDVDKLIINK